jgi:hypothetical protein
MAAEAKVTVDLTITIEQEQLEELFENYEIKFTKKKAKELAQDIRNNEDVWFSEIEEAFADIVGNWLQEMFDK